jgi:hypothetical protein
MNSTRVGAGSGDPVEVDSASAVVVVPVVDVSASEVVVLDDDVLLVEVVLVEVVLVEVVLVEVVLVDVPSSAASVATHARLERNDATRTGAVRRTDPLYARCGGPRRPAGARRSCAHPRAGNAPGPPRV